MLYLRLPGGEPAQAAYLCPGGTHTAYLYCNLLRGPLDGRPARWTELVHCVGFVRYTDTTSGCVRRGRERFASVWLCSVNARVDASDASGRERGTVCPERGVLPTGVLPIGVFPTAGGDSPTSRLQLGVPLQLQLQFIQSYNKGVIDLTLPPLPEEEHPLPVRSICLNLFRKTLYRLPPLFAEDGRGLRTANISKWQPQKTRH